MAMGTIQTICERMTLMAKGKTSGKEITVTGFIEDYEDEDGNYGLQLVSSDEDYIIEIDRVAKGLRDLLGEEV
jgi:hypothetical protein